MSDQSLGSERIIADHREKHSKHLTASLEPLQGKKSNADKAAPSTPVTGVKLGKTGNIRAPHRVTTVTSDASGPHLLNLDNTAHGKTVQTATGYAGASASAARSRDGRLTKERKDLREIIKPRLEHLLHRTHQST